MIEGWLDDEYLVLYEDSELAAVSDQREISRWLPGFQVLGLRGWDDFIVRDSTGRTYTVPAVPILQQHLSPYALPRDSSRLKPDENVRGQIKWNVQPVVFGGDPTSYENMTWLSHEQHIQAVKWWNERYRSITREPTDDSR